MSQHIKDILGIFAVLFAALFALLVAMGVIMIIQTNSEQKTKQMELQVKILELQRDEKK